MDRVKKLIQKAFSSGVSYSQDFGFDRDLEIQYNHNYTYSVFERSSSTDSVAYGKTVVLRVDILDIDKILMEAL